MCLFFKQKTAQVIRISDWSSDVCSSDLHDGHSRRRRRRLHDRRRRHHGGRFNRLIGWRGRRLLFRRRRLFLNIYHIKLLGCLFDIFHAKASDKGITEDSMDKGNDDDRHHSARRSEENTSEHQLLMRTSYAALCLKKTNKIYNQNIKKISN